MTLLAALLAAGAAGDCQHSWHAPARHFQRWTAVAVRWFWRSRRWRSR
jgi:hypothetical protein